MAVKLSTCLVLALLFASFSAAAEQNLYYERAIYTEQIGLSFYPDYPPTLGQTVTVRLRTFDPAFKVTLVSDRFERINLTYRDGHWWGQYTIPADYQSGGHYFTLWIRKVVFDPRGLNSALSKSLVWYKVVEPEPLQAGQALPLAPEVDLESQEPLPGSVTGEAILLPQAASQESELVIKGSQNIAFRSRSLIGSKEGYTPGTEQTREDSLRVSISGRAAETEIEASLYRVSAIGSSQVAENEEEVSIRLKRSSTEAYLGDFTSDLTEAEFTGLNKRLSGAEVKGDYGRWGFKALYSSPKGEVKEFRSYGDGTQGPYTLAAVPVVIDSEQIYVDGQRQVRGRDYTIDYQTGNVTFIDSVVDPKSIILIYYDYRQTVYLHATWGGRGFIRPNRALELGLSYLNDSDSLTNAAAIRGSLSQEAINPQSHYVVGADGSYISENLSAKAEAAYSARNLDLLTAAATQETGRAAKLDLSGSWGPIGLTGRLKWVGPKFAKIAEAQPQQDVWAYAWGLSYRPGALFGARADQDYQKYLQSGVSYENKYQTLKALLTPEQYPSLNYLYSELDESNDPVSGSLIRRAITKNSLETTYQKGIWSTSLKGTAERWLRQSPSNEVTDYRRINFGLATLGLESLSFSSNIELEERLEPDLSQPVKRTVDLKLSAAPSEKYFTSAMLQLIADTAAGQTSVADLAYRFKPSEIFKAEGKYAIKSLLDDFPATSEAVAKQTGSFSFDLRPLKQFRLRYLYKPNFTLLSRTQTLSYNNEQGQAEVNLIPLKYLLLGWLFKQGRSFSVYNQDYPSYTVWDRSELTRSTLYTLKLAPVEYLSTEFNHWQQNSFTSTLATTREPYLYTPGQNLNRQVDLIVKTSPSEIFSIDSRYTFAKTDQGSNGAAANLVDTKSHTASLKFQLNLSRSWTWSLATAYTRTTDYLLSQVTYTFSPGFGFIYRQGSRLRLDFNYTYSKSSAGRETELNQYDFKARYALSDFIDLILLVQQESGIKPDYHLTDVSGNVQITF